MEVNCLREMSGMNGKCPVADLSPESLPANQIVIDIFNIAFETSDKIHGEDKTYYYLKPQDIESLGKIHEVDQADMVRILNGVKILQSIANRQRRSRPKKTKTIIGRGRRI